MLRLSILNRFFASSTTVYWARVAHTYTVVALFNLAWHSTQRILYHDRQTFGSCGWNFSARECRSFW